MHHQILQNQEISLVLACNNLPQRLVAINQYNQPGLHYSKCSIKVTNLLSPTELGLSHRTHKRLIGDHTIVGD